MPFIVRSQLVIPVPDPCPRIPLLAVRRDRRKAANLVPGVNDVSCLSPGLYFLTGVSPGFARKVIIRGSRRARVRNACAAGNAHHPPGRARGRSEETAGFRLPERHEINRDLGGVRHERRFKPVAAWLFDRYL